MQVLPRYDVLVLVATACCGRGYMAGNGRNQSFEDDVGRHDAGRMQKWWGGYYERGGMM